ncbi:SPRY domain-containing protein [Variovorax boronicumulans]|uniref:SPRY domain-containing protein n=1 Tax=Variovorax boronicumulans TaxID=436515 RepID=UPI001C574510
MSAHRYWRVVVRGSAYGFTLSELALASSDTLVAGVPVASVAPVSGSLVSLSDGSTADAVAFDAPLVSFFFDLGAAKEVNNLLVGSGDSASQFPDGFGLAGSDNAALYLPEREFSGVVYPGPNAAVPQVDGSTWNAQKSFNASNVIGLDPAVGSPSSYALVADAIDADGSKKLIEFIWESASGSNQYLGWGDEAYVNTQQTTPPGGAANSASYRLQDGQRYRAGSFSLYGAAYAAGDVIGMVVDRAANTVEMFKNGVSQGMFEDALPTTGPIFPVAFNTGSASTVRVRMGDPFFPVPGAAAWGPAKRLKRRGFQAVSLLLMGEPDVKRQSPWDGFRTFNLNPLTQSGRPFDTPIGRENGLGVIASTVKKAADPANLPLRRKVRCYRERDGLLVGETWSELGTGNYRFEWLPLQEKYTVLSYDHEHNFRAVVADNLSPSVPQ